jgi:hypothetical protein
LAPRIQAIRTTRTSGWPTGCLFWCFRRLRRTIAAEYDRAKCLPRCALANMHQSPSDESRFVQGPAPGPRPFRAAAVPHGARRAAQTEELRAAKRSRAAGPTSSNRPESPIPESGSARTSGPAKKCWRRFVACRPRGTRSTTAACAAAMKPCFNRRRSISNPGMPLAPRRAVEVAHCASAGSAAGQTLPAGNRRSPATADALPLRAGGTRN